MATNPLPLFQHSQALAHAGSRPILKNQTFHFSEEANPCCSSRQRSRSGSATTFISTSTLAPNGRSTSARVGVSGRSRISLRKANHKRRVCWTSCARQDSLPRTPLRRGWDYGCDYRTLYTFRAPLTLADLRSDPYLEDWGAPRSNFRQRVYKIPDQAWSRWVSLIGNRESAGRGLLVSKRLPADFVNEKELEDRIAAEPSLLRPFGFDLELREEDLRLALDFIPGRSPYPNRR